ncbi:MAG: M23 family metallopeptidase [Firmicutes bacterium]|nr:M23 family metallopeptidase [Bacillota bacterium]
MRRTIKTFAILVSTTILPLSLCIETAWAPDAMWPVLCTLYALLLWPIIPWAVLTVHARTFWTVTLITALLFSHHWPMATLYVAALLSVRIACLRSRQASSLSVPSPLKHTAYVLQGGPSRWLNHHWTTTSQQFAVDLIVIDTLGRRAIGLYPAEPEAYFCFGADVVSPIDGTITLVDARHADQPIGSADEAHPAGNLLIIEDETGRRLVLAHLMQDSIIRRTGDKVKRGDLLAKVGNSGRSSEPHLHLHAEQRRSGQWQCIPLRIANRAVWRNAILRQDRSAKWS